MTSPGALYPCIIYKAAGGGHGDDRNRMYHFCVSRGSALRGHLTRIHSLYAVHPRIHRVQSILRTQDTRQAFNPDASLETNFLSILDARGTLYPVYPRVHRIQCTLVSQDTQDTFYPVFPEPDLNYSFVMIR